MSALTVDRLTVDGVDMSRAAALCVDESGCDPRADVALLRAGELTADDLLRECLDQADDDRRQGWEDYVQAVSLAAGQ